MTVTAAQPAVQVATEERDGRVALDFLTRNLSWGRSLNTLRSQVRPTVVDLPVERVAAQVVPSARFGFEAA